MDHCKIIEENHTESVACHLYINWNIDEISKSSNASGYIVQLFSRKAYPSQSFLNDISYFEAWKVENGVCEREKEQICDDMWTVGNGYTDSNEWNLSIGKNGAIHFNGKVYWIPINSELYKIVDTWDVNGVIQANGLKSSYEFQEISERWLIFVRPTFIHCWSLTTIQDIYSKVKNYLFRLCPNNTKRDEQLLYENLNFILDNSEYREICERILSEWYAQW